MGARSTSILAIASCVLALGAGPAWAANEYEAPISPHNFGGGASGFQTFRMGGLGTVILTCETAQFAGSLPAPALTVEEEVKSYGTCEMLKRSATPNVTECSYLFGQPFGTGPYTASMGINNHNVKCEMTFTVSGVCTVVFKAQSSRDVIKLANVGSAAMKVTFSLEGLEYTHSGTGCTGIGSGKDGVYEGVENIEDLRVI